MDALNRKEAIIMGDDITPVTREEYCLKELAAGGGLDYVIPEQTVTLTNMPAVIGTNSLDDVEENEFIVVRTENSRAKVVYFGLSKNQESVFVADEQPENYKLQILKYEGVWQIVIFNNANEVISGEYTISAIRGF